MDSAACVFESDGACGVQACLMGVLFTLVTPAHFTDGEIDALSSFHAMRLRDTDDPPLPTKALAPPTTPAPPEVRENLRCWEAFRGLCQVPVSDM
jgi:hypothetical protein